MFTQEDENNLDMSTPKKPCGECPFRRASAAGWLGEHENAQEIITIIRHDKRFPCHLQVNKNLEEGRDFLEASFEADHCVGALAFMNNTCKMSRNPSIAADQRVVGKREDVFASAAEMDLHHLGKPFPEK